jgi:hypothetical protein
MPSDIQERRPIVIAEIQQLVLPEPAVKLVVARPPLTCLSEEPSHVPFDLHPRSPSPVDFFGHIGIALERLTQLKNQVVVL